MKNNINIILIGLIVCLSGCSILHKNGVIGRAVKKTDRIVAKIQTTKDYQFINMDDKLSAIGGLSYGTEYALNRITNKEPAVSVAKQFNTRVESLANKPNLKESEAVKVLAELLITNSIEGAKELAVKDIEIISLQATSDKLKIGR